jgi:hypothetical protein
VSALCRRPSSCAPTGVVWHEAALAGYREALLRPGALADEGRAAVREREVERVHRDVARLHREALREELTRYMWWLKGERVPPR